MQIGLQATHRWKLIAPLLSSGIILLGLNTRVTAIEPVGDDAELFVTGVASVSQNDNLFLSHVNQENATVFDLTPGLSYEFGTNNAVTKGMIAAYEDFRYFSAEDHGHLNDQLANIIFSLKYDDDKSKMSANASFNQADQAEVGIQNAGYLVERNLIVAGLSDEVSVTDKSSVSGGLNFNDTDYKTPGYTDWRYTEVPVDYYYHYEPKLDLSAGFRFRTNTLGAHGIDSDDYYYNVGARGEFTPNLTGEFDVGYNKADLANGTNEGGVGSDSSFTYAYDQKTSFKFGFNDDYGYAATSFAYRNYGPNIAASTLLYERLTASAQFAYNCYSYLTTSQRDNFYSGQVGVSYKLTLKTTVAVSYSYAQDDSNITLDSFKNNIFTVSFSGHF